LFAAITSQEPCYWLKSQRLWDAQWTIFWLFRKNPEKELDTFLPYSVVWPPLIEIKTSFNGFCF